MLKRKHLLVKQRCAVCQSYEGYLCDDCCDELIASHGIFATRRLATALSVTSLFRYEGIMRDLLLNAKIKSSPAAIHALLKLLQRHSKQIPVGSVIVPAAASFWGRIRGRSDIAWLLARCLAKQRRVEFIEAPLFLQWRWRKQSHVRRLPSKHRAIGIAVPRVQGVVLLVDDVVTSGATLRNLAAYFPVPCRAFTLFSAVR